MSKFKLYFLTTICIFVAFCLPSNLSKTKEAGRPIQVFKPVAAISAPKLVQKDEVATIPVAPVIQAPVASGCGSDPYMAYIYQHESGCNPSAVNSIGCRGIGQACPGDKLPCNADFACQDAYFRNYAISRYGSPYLAMLAWEGQHWW